MLKQLVLLAPIATTLGFAQTVTTPPVRMAMYTSSDGGGTFNPLTSASGTLPVSYQPQRIVPYCTADGGVTWSQCTFGSPAGSGTVSNGSAYAPAYYPSSGNAVASTTPFTGLGYFSTSAPPAAASAGQVAALLGTTTTALGYLDATSSIQGQLGNKLSDPGASGLLARTGPGVTTAATTSGPLHFTGNSLTLDVSSNAATGAMSANDHNALPGISPVGFETGGLNNGVQNLFFSPTLCPQSTGCVVHVNKYPYNAYKGFGAYGWGTGFGWAGQKLESNNGGSTKLWHNNPRPIADQDAVAGIDNETSFWAFDGYSHFGISNLFRESSPGINNGVVGTQVNATPGWSVHWGMHQDLLFQGAGIKGGIDQVLACPGGGDCHNYWYIRCYGVFRTPGDEGCQGLAMHVDDYPSQYKGTISSVSGSLVTTTVLSGNYADIGQQHMAVDLSPSSQIASIYATGHTPFTDPAGAQYESIAIAGGTVTPSKYYGTLNAAIDVPSVPLTYLGTSVTFGFTKTGGAGVPTVGDYLNLVQPYHETVKITAVTGSGTSFQITAYVRKNHSANQIICEWVYGHGGLSFAANSASNANNSYINGSDTFPYYYDVEGAIDSTHLVVTINSQGHLQAFELSGNIVNNSFGNVDFTQIQIAGLTNTGNVTTVLFYDNNYNPRKFSYPTITISGSPNTAFNGQCTNLRNYRYGTGGAFYADCDQPAANGQSQGYTGASTFYFSFGTTGFGNTQATLVPMAEILDVNSYPDQTACLSGSAGACEPYVGGQLRLEPNAMPMPTGGTILVAHDISMLVDGIDLYGNVSNPMTYGNGLVVAFGGSGMNTNKSLGVFQNTQPASSFVGFGGNQTLPYGLSISGALQNSISIGNAPAQNGAVLDIGCPFAPFGCTNTSYTYNLLRLAGNGNSAIVYQPGLNTTHFSGGTYDFTGQLRVQGITEYAMGGAITSASTIAPNSDTARLTAGGVTAIDTITPSSSCTATSPANQAMQSGVSYTCHISLLVVSSGMSFTTAGNIYSAATLQQGQLVGLTYDPVTTFKWFADSGVPTATAPTVASSSSTSIVTGIASISGAAAISSIVPEAGFTYGCKDILATGSWTTVAGSSPNNIYAAMTAASGTQYRACKFSDNLWHIK